VKLPRKCFQRTSQHRSSHPVAHLPIRMRSTIGLHKSSSASLTLPVCKATYAAIFFLLQSDAKQLRIQELQPYFYRRVRVSAVSAAHLTHRSHAPAPFPRRF